MIPQTPTTAPGTPDRPAIEPCADYGALTELWLASVKATHHFLAEEDLEFYRRRLPAAYMPQVDLYAIRGADGAWGAFIGLAGDSVEMLFVHPREMGKGLGSALLRFAIERKGIVRVGVNEQNDRALAFYLRHGFSIAGRDETDGEGKPYPVLRLRL